ncbi:MAG: DJ-1/PfpI family protein [Lautropia sp.]
MGKIGVFLYSGFQEMEFWYPVLRLREIGADVVVIGVEGREATASVLDYPVVPHLALAETTPGDYAALIIPGGNVARLAEDAAFRTFVREAAARRVRLMAASQAAALVSGSEALVAATTDDVPRITRTLIEELQS